MKLSVKRTGRQFFGLVLPVLLFVTLLMDYHTAPGEEKAEDMWAPTDDNLIVVRVSQVGSESAWRTANTTSTQEAFTRENGYFLTFDNARQKQENQIKALRSFISRQVDYIVSSPITEDGWDTMLQEAREAGIPVILIGKEIDVRDQSLYTTWIGSDFQKEERMAGETLAGYLKARGRQEEDIRMVVLQRTKGATTTIGRSTGSDEVAKLNPNWLVLEQVDAEFMTTKGQEEMKRLLARYEGIDMAISRNNNMTFGVLDAIHQTGRTVGEAGDILVISFDTMEGTLKLMEDGVVTADVECSPNQGEYVEAIIRQLENGRAVDRMNFLPERIFIRKNVQEFRSGNNG